MLEQMPYIHWEDKAIYKHYRHTIEKVEVGEGLRKSIRTPIPSNMPESKILVSSNLKKEQLIFEKRPQEEHWQVRRSLDQSYYSSLEDTFERDNDQVVDRFARCLKAPGNTKVWPVGHEPILMVHQLWLWVVNGKSRIRFSISIV